MSLQNLIYKKKRLELDELDELARYLDYDNWEEYLDKAKDDWFGDIHNCDEDAEYPPFDKFLQKDAREKIEKKKDSALRG